MLISEREPAVGGFSAELVDASGERMLVVHGRGELDLATRDEFRAAITAALRHHTATPEPRLVIDLRLATYIGATVVAAMIEEVGRIPGRPAARLVVGRSGIVSRVAAILDLGEVFDVVEDGPS